MDGALVRTELANGIVFVVRENPATPVACIVTAVRMPESLSAARALEIGRLAARSGVGSPAARVASLGGMIEVSVEGDVLYFSTSVLGSDVDAVLATHAALFAVQMDPSDPPVLLTERTTVVLSGRANAYTALSAVQREFGTIRKPEPPAASLPAVRRPGTRPPAPAVAPPPPPAPVVVAPSSRYVVRQGAMGPASVTITFDPPTLAASDGAAVDVLAAALGVGRTSRLSLAYGEGPIASDASAQTVWVGSRRGYMQVMPFWTRSIGDGDAGRLFHMQTNLRFGCVILRHYLDIEKGDLFLALGRYNGSRGRAEYPNAVFANRRQWLGEEPALAASRAAPGT